MARTRAALIEAIRPFGPNGKLSSAQVALIDRLADAFGLPAASAPAPPPKLRPSPAALALIKQYEGLHDLKPDGRVAAYKCPAGVWTIGYGATGAGIDKGAIWSRQQCDDRLKKDVERFADGVRTQVSGVATSQNQFDALVSFAFNVGLDALADSTLLRKHRAGDKAGAAAEFGRWTKAGGKVLPGLVTRRRAEADLYQA